MLDRLRLIAALRAARCALALLAGLTPALFFATGLLIWRARLHRRPVRSPLPRREPGRVRPERTRTRIARGA